MDTLWAALIGGATVGIIMLAGMLVSDRVRPRIRRERVSVTVTVGSTQSHDGPTDPTVFIEAVNSSRRTVVLSAFGYRYRRKEWCYVAVTPDPGSELPHRLAPRDSYSHSMPVAEVVASLAEQGRTPQDLKEVWFRLRSGKEFTSAIPGHVHDQIAARFSALDSQKVPEDEPGSTEEAEDPDPDESVRRESTLRNLLPIWIGISVPLLTGVVISIIDLSLYDRVKGEELTLAGLAWDIAGFLMISIGVFRRRLDPSIVERLDQLVLARWGFGLVVGGLMLQMAGVLR